MTKLRYSDDARRSPLQHTLFNCGSFPLCCTAPTTLRFSPHHTVVILQCPMRNLSGRLSSDAYALPSWQQRGKVKRRLTMARIQQSIDIRVPVHVMYSQLTRYEE